MKIKSRLLSLALTILMTLTMIPPAAFAKNAAQPAGSDEFGLTPEYEASLTSLLSQLSSEGIGINGLYAADATLAGSLLGSPLGSLSGSPLGSPLGSLTGTPPETPSGINPWTRVSCEIVTPGVADYETPQDAKVRFTLENPGGDPVSFSYKIISGSASTDNLEDTQPMQGTVSFGGGETVKEIIIGIAPLVNNPVEWGHISDREEYWTGERIFFLYCRDIQNALFDNNKDSLTVPVPIVNNFNFEQAYNSAADTYLFDLSELSGVASYPETPGKYANTGDEIRISVPIAGDVRTLIDTGVFTRIDFPTGHISNESTTPCSVEYRVEAKAQLSGGTPVIMPAFSETLALDGESEAPFGGEQHIMSARLGRAAEHNTMVRSVDFILDYSALTDVVYTWFGDTQGNYPENQVRFSDKTAPYIQFCVIPAELSGGVRLGDTVPIVVSYNEPVHTDNISMVIGDVTQSPLEAAGTVSESVTFPYELDDPAIASGVSFPTVSVSGASDISGRQQADTPDSTLSPSVPFDSKNAFTHCAHPSVLIEQGESLQARGTITLEIDDHMDLSNWLIEYMSIGDNLMSNARARVIGGDGEPVEVALYAHIDGVRITELTGEFSPPVNQTGQDRYYAAEIYLDNDGPEGAGPFELIYALIGEYTVPPVIFIDDESDFEIVYTAWPAADTVLAGSAAPLSLGCKVNVNATWQRPEDFSWSSGNTAVADITPEGVIILTGEPGTVTFTLTALNAGLADEFSIASRTLTVAQAQSPFLLVPAGAKNIEIFRGSDAKVYYSTNIPSRNDVSPDGSGAATEISFSLYEAGYSGGTPHKGSLVHSDVSSISAENPEKYFTVPGEFLVNTSSKGIYSYILEISARDLNTDTDFSDTAGICVKPLPAKAVLVKPDSLFITDEASGFTVSFDIKNRTPYTECIMTVKKNSGSEPVLSIDSTDEAGRAFTVPVGKVAANRLFDAYTVSLKAKNEFDGVYSFDSFTLYVYNANAMKIIIGGSGNPYYTMKPDIDYSDKNSAYIMNTYKEISYTVDGISINKNDYHWSNIADRITWEAGDEGKVTLKFNGNIITGESAPLLLPGSALALEAHESGRTYLTATHALTGMEARVDITIEDIRDKLYIFQTYPRATCEVTYTNGHGTEITTQTDDNGRLGVYEESGVRGDVLFRPTGHSAGLYDCTTLRWYELRTNQHSANEFALHPQNIVTLPRFNYRVTLELFDEETGAPYTDDVIIRGGAWVNGEYRYGVVDGHWSHITTINGKKGVIDQTVSPVNGLYTLNYNSMEFADRYGRLSPDDQIKYAIEVRFPGVSHYPQFIEVDNDSIRKNMHSPLGVYVKEAIRSVDPSLVQNKAIIVSETLNVDGSEYSFNQDIVLTSEPDSITVSMDVILPDGGYGSNYSFLFADIYQLNIPMSAPVNASKKYEFASTVVLSGTVDLKPLLKFFKPGQKLSLYPHVTGSGVWMQLPKPVRMQKLYNIPSMSEIFYREGGVQALRQIINSAGRSAGTHAFDGADELVEDMLDVTGGFGVNPDNTYRLEIIPTGDPLVYKGVVRFAAGSYSRENPSGIFVAGDESIAYSFMPGYSEIKEMTKGDYLKKSRQEMENTKNGTSGYYKSYGGGAYMECEIRYDVEKYVWRILLLKSDMYLGGGITYYTTYNGWVGFVPVTATFKTGMTGEIGLKTVYDKNSNTRAYITELRPYFSIYGFAGAGFDYEIFALKIGPYGMLSHDQRFLWYNRGDDKRNGQKLTISGSTGIEFKIKLLFIEVNGRYKLVRTSKSWTYNDFNLINNVFDTGKILSMLSGDTPADFNEDGTSISGTAAFEGRSYLEGSDRKWNTPAAKSVPVSLFRLMGSSGLPASPVDILLPNAYPYSNPMLTGDGRMMVYLHDMGSANFMDTAVCFTTRDGGEDAFPEGAEIDVSRYPDSGVSVAGTGDNAVAVWTRMFADFDAASGEDVTSGDIADMLAGAEIMAAVYNGGSFATTRLTIDSTPDMAPVAAVGGNKAIAAWRSVVAGDMEKPLEFTGRDEIMYSIFDGAIWSEPRVLYDGGVDHVGALNAAALSDGTMAVTYQITQSGTANSEIMCVVLDSDGEVKNRLRLTNNETSDDNPQITSALFPDGTERFVLGWNARETLDGKNERNLIRLSAIDSSGNPYPGFDMELGNASDMNSYACFRFVKGAMNIEDLSIVWKEPDLSITTGPEGIYRDCVRGIKLIKENDGSIANSGGLRLLELEENNAVDSLDAAVDPDTGEISFALLISDYGEEKAKANLAFAKARYQNEIIADEPYFNYEDALPGLETPVLFRIQNAGAENIERVSIELGGVSNVFDEIMRPGESRDFTVFCTVPDPVEDMDYTINAHFTPSMETISKDGALKLDVPDIEIEQINVTKESNRERSFSVLLRNGSYAELAEGRHTVRLKVYDTTDFENGTPLAVETISDAERLNMLNDGMLPLSVTLSGEAITRLLDEKGEIPENGVWIFFDAVLEEDGKVVEDADIGNNMDYIKLYSLIEKNGAPVSITSVTETIGGQTAVRVGAFNNSMNGIANGNIIVALKDQRGNTLATQQTYNPADATGSMVGAAGEGTCAAAFLFEQAGSSVDVSFSRIDKESTKLSVLKMSGVPLDFSKDVFQYDFEVTDRTETLITAVAENPDSSVSIVRNGVHVPASQPCTLSYGANTFVITVTAGGHEEVYTVNVVNARGDGDDGEGDDGGDGGSGGAETGDNAYFSANLIFGGAGRAIPVRVESGKAVISLSGLADIFAGSENAELTVPPIPGVKSYTLEMPADALSGPGGTATLTVNTEFGSIAVPSGLLAGMTGSAGMTGLAGRTAGITIERGGTDGLPEDIKAAIGDRPVIRLSLAIDGKRVEWNNPGAPVKVSIPYTPSAGEAENPESIVIWYIDGSGKAICVPDGRYDPVNGVVTFFTTHFSRFAAVYNKVGFGDVPAGLWFSKAVSFIAARGVTLGTGGGYFSPNARLTRGEFIVLLMRAYGIAPDENSIDNFSDAGDTYYTGYLAAAKRLGISAGTGNNMYAPGREITRQEMFTLLYNALKKTGQLPGGNSGKKLSDFADAGQINSWAREAMALLVETGAISGSGGRLFPKGTATRAEAAQLLERAISPAPFICKTPFTVRHNIQSIGISFLKEVFVLWPLLLK